jgi:hypothetical protein
MSIVPLLLLLLFSVQLESARFQILVEGRNVGTEEFSIGRNGESYIARARTRLVVEGTALDAESRMELDHELNPISYEYRSGAKIIRIDIGDELAAVEFIVDGQSTPYDVRLPAGAMIIDDNFFHHYLLLLYKAGESGGSIPVFVPQQMTLGTLVVDPSGDNTFELDSDNLRLRAVTDANGRMLQLDLLNANVVVRR